ncbi:MAG: Flp pilus assembly protein CpaB [Chloroflexi bacterium]|nr:Flp pilus assembly protein CpaB [Chloroflexota bacterium]
MRRGGRILVLLGLILGLLTAGGTFLVLSSSQSQGQQIPTRPVIIAQQNIPARSEISPSALGTANWPEAYIPVGAFDKSDQVAGKLAIDAIYQGQIILPQMLIDKTQVKETRSNASFLIPDGKVAVAFPITDLSGVAGAIQAGDSVDILLTLDPGTMSRAALTTTTTAGTQGMAASQLMLQDVPIINIGAWPSGPTPSNQSNKSTGPATMVTFVLDRQDALALKAARELGTIELALRRAGDHKSMQTESVTLQYLNKRFNFNLVPAGK